MPEDLVNRLDAHVITPAARRITGLGFHTRAETLHFPARTMSYRNLYLCHTAGLLHSTLLAQGSQIQTRTRNELCEQLEVETLRLRTTEVSHKRTDAFFLGSEHLPPTVFDHAVREIREYIEKPNWDTAPQDHKHVRSTCPRGHSSPVIHQRTFKFKGTL